MKKILMLIFLTVLIFALPNPPLEAAGSGDVFVIPVTGLVDPGMAGYIHRAVSEAEEADASAIILEIDTPGGRVDSAVEISETLFDTKVPVVAFVKKEASSAGVLITISADRIVMAPGTTIGAAEPRPKEEKIVSYWASKLRSAADRAGRDSEIQKIVAAMADADIEIPGVVEKGKILSLTAKQAVDLKLADKLLSTREQILEDLGLKDRKVIEIFPTFGEQLARFVTNPYVSPLLLTLGFIGVLIEVFIPGFGVPGIIGLLSFALFFGGHMLTGLAGWETVAFFLLGLLLLIVEIFVPGFGIFGIAGIISIIGSIIAASVSVKQALFSIVFSFIVSIIVLVLLFKRFSRSSIFDRLVLYLKQDKTAGYSAPVNQPEIVGKVGVTITPLHPAGTIQVEGNRIDVVSEGGYIDKNVNVRIVKVEGTRVIVRPE